MANERVTEDIVRSHFKNDLLMNSDEIITIKEQKDERFNYLFATASKNEKGNKGYPEFIISFKRLPNFIIIVECKSDINYHQSTTSNKPKDYAVDGILYYMKIANAVDKKLSIIGIAVSGMNISELKVSNFLYKDDSIIELHDKELLSFNSYLKIYNFQNYSLDLQNLKIIEKAIEYNNLLENYAIPTTERATFISAILLALHNDGFRDGYINYSSVKELTAYIIQSCENYLKDKISEDRRTAILSVYRTIQNHKITSSETLQNKQTKKMEANILLKKIIDNIKTNIYPLVNYDNTGFDILGKFYSEFIKYAGSDSKTGLVLTPSHITDLFCELINLNKDDVVYDPCCGTGGFLVSAMKKMISLAENNQEKINIIKSSQIIGSEERADMFAYACSNMMMRGDGKSNVYHADCFNANHKALIKSLSPTVVMLNPPYSVGAEGQLDFILNALDILTKGGRCIAIIQMSCVLDSDTVIEKHRQIIEKHTVEAVISMPDDLFYPSATVPTCIMVLRSHEPNNTPTWFGYWKDDGFKKEKKKGRINLGEYNDKHQLLMDNYRYYEKTGFSIIKKINYNDEWCAEAYIDISFSNIPEIEFINTMKEYLSIMFYFGKLSSISANSFSISANPLSPIKPINKIKLSKFKLVYDERTKQGIFTVEKGERLNKNERIKGNTPLLTSTSFYNGVSEFIDRETFIETKKVNCNKITIDMLANVFYQGYEYFGDDNVHTLSFQSDEQNIYVKMYIITLLKKLKIKYAYGRQVRIKRLIDEYIYLPSTNNGQPDWNYMENYIKSLPYSASI
ncbi:MAG: N-6 DNA methylase [Phycisphaerales bacterium]|nr:N-6 DNA methylase [Phycisphaerales bacterium]